MATRKKRGAKRATSGKGTNSSSPAAEAAKRFLPWNSPEVAEILKQRLVALADNWAMVAHANPADERAVAVARILSALHPAWETDAPVLDEMAKSAGAFLRSKDMDLHGHDRPEAAVFLRTLVDLWRREGRALDDMAPSFVGVLQNRPVLVAALREPLDSPTAVDLVRSATTRAIEAKKDSELVVIAALKALGYPELKAHGLFKFLEHRTRNS